MKTLGPFFHALALSLATSACTNHGANDDPNGTVVEPETGEPGGSNDDTAGQSGTETQEGVGGAPAPARTCACLGEDRLLNAVRGELIHVEGGCAELKVTESAHPEFGPQKGDVIGGELQTLCDGDPLPESGAAVLALYSRGAQDSASCIEYRQCSQERCGSEDDIPDNEDYPEASAEYDRCDTECLEETQELCEAHGIEAQLGGTLTIINIDAEDNVTYFWAGEERTDTLETLSADSCHDYQLGLLEEYLESLEKESPADSPDEETAGDAPPETDEPPRCPSAERLELHESSAEPSADAGPPASDAGKL